MAAATTTITVLAKGVMAPEHIPANIDDWAPWPTSKPIRYAALSILFDTGDYAAGGIACNLLAALTGWTKIYGVTQTVAMMNTSVPSIIAFADQNSGTAGSRKITVNVLATGAAHAASALTAETVIVTAFGY